MCTDPSLCLWIVSPGMWSPVPEPSCSWGVPFSCELADDQAGAGGGDPVLAVDVLRRPDVADEVDGVVRLGIEQSPGSRVVVGAVHPADAAHVAHRVERWVC